MVHNLGYDCLSRVFYCCRDGVTISTINGDILRKLLFSNVLDRLCPETFSL